MKKIMNRSCLFLLLVLAPLQVLSQDHIIFRNGQESDVRLYQVDDEKIVFSYCVDYAQERQEIASKEVYMIFIEKQGNVYFTSDGKRITGETDRVNPKKYNAIYLVKGQEIPADEIKVEEDVIKFSYTDKGKGLKKVKIWDRKVVEGTLNKSDVFFIRYKSGMVDIITPLDAPTEPKQSKPSNDVEYSVVYHKVVKGETVEDIASKYNVSVQDVIVKNDLPRTTKPTTRLQAGKELMIYKPKTR